MLVVQRQFSLKRFEDIKKFNYILPTWDASQIELYTSGANFTRILGSSRDPLTHDLSNIRKSLFWPPKWRCSMKELMILLHFLLSRVFLNFKDGFDQILFTQIEFVGAEKSDTELSSRFRLLLFCSDHLSYLVVTYIPTVMGYPLGPARGYKRHRIRAYQEQIWSHWSFH